MATKKIDSKIPDSFSEARADLVLEQLQAGVPWDTACAAADVSIAAVRKWLQLGRQSGAPLALAKFAHLADDLRPLGPRERHAAPSDAALATLLDHLRGGESWKDAAAAIGVDMRAVTSWRRKGRSPGAPEQLVAFVKESDAIRPTEVSRKRPKRSQFNPDNTDRILAGLRDGLSISRSVAATDVAPRTLAYWLAQGREPDASEELKRFAQDVAQARADAILNAVGTTTGG